MYFETLNDPQVYFALPYTVLILPRERETHLVIVNTRHPAVTVQTLTVTWPAFHLALDPVAERLFIVAKTKARLNPYTLYRYTLKEPGYPRQGSLSRLEAVKEVQELQLHPETHKVEVLTDRGAVQLEYE